MSMQKYINSSIHRYMLFWMSIVTTFVFLTIACATIIYNKNIYEEELQHELESLTRISAQSLGSAIWQYNDKYISDYSHALFYNNLVLYVRVTEKNKSAGIELARIGSRIVSVKETDIDSQFSSTSDINYSGIHVGTISITMDDSQMWKEAVYGSIIAIFCLLSFLLLTTIALYYLFRKRVYIQLVELENGARKAADGHFDHHIEIYNKDEIGRLAQSFNEMLANLKLITASRDELNDEIKIRKQAEQDLAESKRLLEAVLEGIGAAVFYVNPLTSKITEANQVGLDLLKLPLDKVIDHYCRDLICLINRHADKSVCPKYMKKSIHNEGLLTLHDGTRLNVIKHVLPAKFKGNRFHVEILFDVSEQTAMKEQLQNARKLEAVGILAAGVAHEINTPIQYITENIKYALNEITVCNNAIKLCSRHIETQKGNLNPELNEIIKNLESIDGDDVCSSLNESLEGTIKIAEIVRAMKIYAHPSRKTKTAVDLNAAVENAVIVTQSEWKHFANVELDLHPSTTTCWCTQGDIPQILINLILNASHAIAEKKYKSGDFGKIEISTVATFEHASIVFQDNGTGISASDLDKIYDPFFTTKEVGKGTGQGLSIVLSLVNKNGGSINCSSEEGLGTRFEIILPAVKDNSSKV